MKKYWALFVLGICILQSSTAGVPVSAKDYEKDSFKQQADADKDAAKADRDRAISRMDAYEGRSGVRSRARQAFREDRRAMKHEFEASRDQAIDSYR